MSRETQPNPEAEREKFKNFIEHRAGLQQQYYPRIAKQLRARKQALELSDYASAEERSGRASNEEVIMSDADAVERILAKVKATEELRARDPNAAVFLPKNWQECLARIRGRYDLRERLSGMIGDTLKLQESNTAFGKPVSDEAIAETQRGTLYYLDSLLARHEALDRLSTLLEVQDKKHQ